MGDGVGSDGDHAVRASTAGAVVGNSAAEGSTSVRSRCRVSLATPTAISVTTTAPITYREIGVELP